LKRFAPTLKQHGRGFLRYVKNMMLIGQVFIFTKMLTAENLDRYARAREKQLDYLEELMIQISMDEERRYVS
jgi:hypothetical protein